LEVFLRVSGFQIGRVPDGWKLGWMQIKEVGCSRVQGVRCLKVKMERFQSYKEFVEVKHDARNLETGFCEL